MSMLEKNIIWTGCIYARKSTSKLGQKETIKNQISTCKSKGNDLKINIVDTKTDTGTGTDDLKRPEVQKLINDAINGKYNCVIMKGVSRLYRDTEKGLALIKLLDRNGIRVISIEEGFDSLTDRVGNGKLDTSKITMYLMFAEMESKKLADRVKYTQIEKAKRGEWNQPSSVPIGYKYNTNTKKLEIDYSKADIVRKIFKMYSEGSGLRNIMLFLNGDNPENKMYPSPKGNLWNQYTIGFILKNEAYIGNVVYNRRSKKERTYKSPEAYGKSISDIWIGNDHNNESEWIRTENAHEAIISRELFDKVASIMATKGIRKGIKSNVSLLSGIAKCGICKSGMTFKRGNKDKNGWIKTKNNYYCMNYIKLGANFCTSHHVGADDLEKFVIDNLIELYNNKEHVEQLSEKINVNKNNMGQNEKQLANYEQEIKKITEKMDKLLEMNMSNRITDQQFDTMNRKLTEDLTSVAILVEKLKGEMDNTISEEDKRNIFIRRLEDAANIENFSKEEKRYLLLDLVDEIVVNSDNTIDITYNL